MNLHCIKKNNPVTLLFSLLALTHFSYKKTE